LLSTSYLLQSSLTFNEANGARIDQIQHPDGTYDDLDDSSRAAR